MNAGVVVFSGFHPLLVHVLCVLVVMGRRRLDGLEGVMSVGDRDSLHLPVTLTLPTPRFYFQMSCTSTCVAFWSGSLLFSDI
jgi:hypothetical protein